VIKPLTTNAEEVMFQELLIMQKYMDWLTKNVLLIVQALKLQNKVKRKPQDAKNIKLLITAFQKKCKILSKKFSITAQSLP